MDLPASHPSESGGPASPLNGENPRRYLSTLAMRNTTSRIRIRPPYSAGEKWNFRLGSANVAFADDATHPVLRAQARVACFEISHRASTLQKTITLNS